MSAHAYHRMCGCSQCGGDELRHESHEESVEALAEEYRGDDAKLREAESWVAGTFDGDHYTDVTLALHELHHTDPCDLVGSDVLTRLYALAKVEAMAIDAQLLQQARDYLEMRSAA